MSRIAAPWIIAVLACGAACAWHSTGAPAGGAPTPPPATSSAPARAAAPPPRDDGRLPPTATPLRYALSLHVDPTEPRFSGVATILVELEQSTPAIVLHARDMRVQRAVAYDGHGGGAPTPATATLRQTHSGSPPDELVLVFARPLSPGRAELRIDYDAPFAPDLAGLYRVQEQGRWYAYTQFEATDARRAFPCFDEPGYKTPFDISIEAPRDLKVIANSPERGGVDPSNPARSGAPNDAPKGIILHTFETTPPLPSYLVAFAVGDFDVAEGPTAPVPIRVIAPKGRGSLAGMALSAAPAILAKLGEYFDMRYPYAKLDLVAVPDFAAGAMENPGLVTFRDVLLLVDPNRATTTIKRSQAEVITHELSHQWFGDLVTMKWWDDLWLNEGFATWAEAKIVDAWRPGFGATADEIAGVQGIMDTDALSSARAVREPVKSTGEAMEAFDGITYDKGAAVLRMIESWLGESTFRRGVQRYVREHAWKNAGASDLFDALEFVSAQSVAKLASGFLDQPGVPQVQASWTCSASGGMAKLDLHASEWRPLGEPREPSARTWTVPVCISSDAFKNKNCFTLGANPITRDLGPRCPRWVDPNAGLAGYYRFSLDPKQLTALVGASASLSATDRLGVLSNAWAGVRSGAIAPSTLLEILPTLDADTNRYIVEIVVGILSGFDHALVTDETRAGFRKYVVARLRGRKKMLGWEPSAAPNAGDDDRALQRRSVLGAMGDLGRDEETLREAERYAAQWLKDPTSVASDTAAIAVPLASLRAGPERFDELRNAAKSAITPQDRTLAIRAMGALENPVALRRALDLTLTDELKLSELRYVFGGAASLRGSRELLFAWEKENWPSLRKRMPGSFGRGMLIAVAGGFCTREAREDARSFFVSKVDELEGAKRPLDEALEGSGLCVALHEQAAPRVSAWLGAHPLR